MLRFRDTCCGLSTVSPPAHIHPARERGLQRSSPIPTLRINGFTQTICYHSIKAMEKQRNLYSLWILPPAKISNILASIIKKLSQKYKSPIFEPHLTLLDGFSATKEEALSGTKKLFSLMKLFSLSFGEVSFSTTYGQCVFVRIKSNAFLMDYNLLAKKIFKIENSIFMPHMSLLYAHLSMKNREKLATEIKIPTLSFISERLAVTLSTNNPQDWKPLTEYSFR
jgi:hypothetical protein